MIESLRIRETAEEARDLDNGEVPGDHLGAAGFDSAFFAHLKVSIIYYCYMDWLIILVLNFFSEIGHTTRPLWWLIG